MSDKHEYSHELPTETLDAQQTAQKRTIWTPISVIFIFIQSAIIGFGLYYRWDWITYEFAALLIIPAVVILWYGVLAMIKVDKTGNGV